MYHSHLLVNVGDNPDRPDWRNCRRWIRNVYRVHQRLSMAFPAEDSPTVLDNRCPDTNEYPYFRDLPTEAGEDAPQVRSEKMGFLFRIDYPVDWEKGRRRPVIIVQSATKPNWEHAFGLLEGTVNSNGQPIGNAGFLLAAPPQRRPISFGLDGDTLALNSEKEDCRFRPGDLVRFRLHANPTRKVQDGSPNGRRKRVNPTLEDHTNWLVAKLGDAARPLCIENFVPGWRYGWRTQYEPQPRQRMQWWSVLFEGTFRLRDTSVLKRLLESGIGSAKAFGFGLLSVARV